jgi:hypothetical protein
MVKVIFEAEEQAEPGKTAALKAEMETLYTGCEVLQVDCDGYTVLKVRKVPG